MARNGAGTYSLAAGNPVTPGTTILSNWANQTLQDIANGLTDSLSRSGLGGMQQPLKLSDGVIGAPALSFTAEAGLGLYRSGDGLLSFAVSAVDYLVIGDSQVVSNKPLLGFSGVFVTQSESNIAGLTVTGNGTAAGAVVTGGSTAGNGLTVTGGAGNGVGAVITGGSTGRGATIAAGGGNNAGVVATGSGTGAGVSATGGATGAGGSFTGGAAGDGLRAVGGGTSASGIYATGGAGGVGGFFEAGTAATGSTPSYGLTIKSGYLNFTTATNPNGDVAFTNSITPANIPKAWVRFRTDGLGGVVILDGFNVTSAAIDGGDVDVTFATAFANTEYIAMGNVFQAFLDVIMNDQTTTVATIRAGTQAGGSIGLNTTPLTVDVLFFGRQ